MDVFGPLLGASSDLSIYEDEDDPVKSLSYSKPQSSHFLGIKIVTFELILGSFWGLCEGV